VIAIEPLQQILELATQNDLLHKIRGRETIIRTSLYTDDAVVFVAPQKEDIQNLSTIQSSPKKKEAKDMVSHSFSVVYLDG
jgi:hypothetical protein